MDYLQRQVHIAKDGFDIQTTIEQYKSYYKHLGWQYVDQPPTLPGIVVDKLPKEFIHQLKAKQIRLI